MAQSWTSRIVSEIENRTRQEPFEFWGKRANDKTPVFNYRLEHIKEVVKLSVKLAEELGADRDVVLSAAWLHDIAKPSLGEKRGRPHEIEGAIQARKVLEGTDFPPTKIDAVCDAIVKHKGLYKDHKVEPLEAAILWDADKLSKLGATSIVHFLAAGPWPDDTDYTTEGILRQNIEWFEVIDKIASSMNTEPAMKMARKRAQVFKEFFRQLERESEAKE